MKIKTSSRVTAIILALMMIVPLISVPTFAEDATDPWIWRYDFESGNKADAFSASRDNMTIQASTTASDNHTANLELTGIEGGYALYNTSSKAALYLDPTKGTLTISSSGYLTYMTDELFSWSGKQADYIAGSINSSVSALVNGGNEDETCLGAFWKLTRDEEGNPTYNDKGSLIGTNAGANERKVTHILPVNVLDMYCGTNLTGIEGYVARLNNFASPAQLSDSVTEYVYSLDFYVSADAYGYVAGKVGITTDENGTTATLQPLQFNMTGEGVVIGADGGGYTYVNGAAKTVTRDAWHNVKLAINKGNAQCRVYVDNVFAYEYKLTDLTATKVELQENAFGLQINRRADKLAGNIEFDNVALYASLESALGGEKISYFSTDFENVAFGSVASKGTYNEMALVDFDNSDNGTAMKIPVAPYNGTKYCVKKVDTGTVYLVLDEVESDGTLTGGTVSIGGTEYTVSGPINNSSVKTAIDGGTATLTASDGTTLADYYICPTELGEAYSGGYHMSSWMYIKHGTVSADAFVIEYDMYVPQGVKINKTYPQINVLNSSGAATAVRPYTITSDGSKISLVQNNGTLTKADTAIDLPNGVWHHLALAITNSGACVLYGDGVKLADIQLTATDIRGLSGASNKWYGFENARKTTSMSSHTSGGCMYIDNFAINASYDATATRDVYHSEGFSYYAADDSKVTYGSNEIPSTATYAPDPSENGTYGTTIKLPLTITTADTTPVLVTYEDKQAANYYTVATFTDDTNTIVATVSTGETVTYYSENTNAPYYTVGSNTGKYYLSTLKDAHAYWGDNTATNRAWRMNNPQITTDITDKVILSNDIYFSTNASGKIETQFHTYTKNGEAANWLNLYNIDINQGILTFFDNSGKGWTSANGLIQKGQWYNIAVELDLTVGSANLYINGAYVASSNGSMGVKIGLNANRWVVAKSARKFVKTADELSGEFYVDNLKITNGETNVVNYPDNDFMYATQNGVKSYATKYFTGVHAAVPTYFSADAYADMLSTEKENQIRLTTNADTSGIRYATKVDEALLDELYAWVENGNAKAIEFGTMIAPVDYITFGKENAVIADEFTVAGLDTNQALTDAMNGANAKYLMVQATHNAYYSEFDTDESTTHFVGSIVDILPNNINRAFAGRGYVKITLADDSVVYIYSDTVNTATIKEKAQAVIDRGIYTVDSPEYNILVGYAGPQASAQ